MWHLHDIGEDQYFIKFLSEFINVSPQGAKTGSCKENEHLKIEIIAKYAEHGQVSVMKVNIVSIYLGCILKKTTMKFTTTAHGNRKLIKDGLINVSPQGAKTGSCGDNEHLKLKIIAKYAEHG